MFWPFNDEHFYKTDVKETVWKRLWAVNTRQHTQHFSFTQSHFQLLGVEGCYVAGH